MILCSNPHAQYLAQKLQIEEAIARVLKSGRYILGQEVQSFEEEFARYIGASFGIGVGSGTEALHIALAACGVKSGDEVITVSNTAVATVAAIELTGAKPVFVDIEPDSYVLDTNKLEQAITMKTRAIVPVHLYGNPVDLEPVLAIAKKNGIRVIEDCAQAHGAVYRGKKVGAWGDMACFSFYPTKNLGAFGDGGLVVTNDSALAEKVRLLREYGWKERNFSVLPGWNTRLDELQAAVLRVKLRTLDDQNEKRRKLAELYNNALQGTSLCLPQAKPGTMHVYHLYVVRSRQRDKLLAYLKNSDIGVLVHYPVPIHCQPAYQGTCMHHGLDVTEKIVQEILSLPMYPELAQAEARSVVKAIHAFYGAAHD